LLIFLISSIVTVLLFNATRQVIEEYTISAARNILERNKDAVDAYLKDVANIVERMAEDNNVQSFMTVSKPMNDLDYEQLRNMKAKLPVTYASKSFFKYLYVFFPKSDVLISPSFASARMELIYEHYLKYDQLSYPDWKSQITSNRTLSDYWGPCDVSIEGVRHTVITYIRYLFSPYAPDATGVVISLIDVNDLTNILDNDIFHKGGSSWIQDKKGDLIALISDDHAQSLDLVNEDTSVDAALVQSGRIFIETQSDFNDWRYYAAIPTRVLMQKAYTIRDSFILAMGVAFLVIFILAFIIARKNSRPIQDMVVAFRKYGGKSDDQVGNEYDFITGSIYDLFRVNKGLQDDLLQQKRLNQNTFFDRLIRNAFANLPEMENHLSHVEIQFTQPAYQVVVSQINGYYGQVTKELLDDLNDIRVLVARLMHSIIGSLGYIHIVSEDKVALFLNLPAQYELRPVIEEIQTELRKYKIFMSFGVGTVKSNLLDFHESYHEAGVALESLRYQQIDYCEYQSSMAEQERFDFSAQTEEHLLALIHAGDKAGVAQLLQSIHQNNFILRNLDLISLRLLYVQICSSMLRLRENKLTASCVDMNEIDQLNQSISKSPSEGAYWSLAAVFQAITDKVNAERLCHHSRLRDRVIEYLAAHYTDQSLCLYSVALHFNLAEKYFSRFFKEQVGENFSCYLEKIRMRQAKVLLACKKKTIQEIAEQVGYQNTNTFYKAFKRIYGVSPRDSISE
jgi:AraC-like DNA-binding protein